MCIKSATVITHVPCACSRKDTLTSERVRRRRHRTGIERPATSAPGRILVPSNLPLLNLCPKLVIWDNKLVILTFWGMCWPACVLSPPEDTTMHIFQPSVLACHLHIFFFLLQIFAGECSVSYESTGSISVLRIPRTHQQQLKMFVWDGILREL